MDVVAVVSQPDRPAGRNQKINVPPTKVVALSHNIAILQPESLVKSPEIVEALKSFGADFIVMVAFGQILKSCSQLACTRNYQLTRFFASSL